MVSDDVDVGNTVDEHTLRTVYDPIGCRRRHTTRPPDERLRTFFFVHKKMSYKQETQTFRALTPV